MFENALPSNIDASNRNPKFKTCYFIDDDEDDRDFLCAALQTVSPDTECFFAVDGLQALRKFETDPGFVPDFIFIDMNMPFLDGKQCLSAIKKIPRLEDVPVYLYSTSGSPKQVEEVIALGATDFLIKPVTMQALEDMLRNVVTQS